MFFEKLKINFYFKKKTKLVMIIYIKILKYIYLREHKNSQFTLLNLLFVSYILSIQFIICFYFTFVTKNK